VATIALFSEDSGTARRSASQVLLSGKRVSRSDAKQNQAQRIWPFVSVSQARPRQRARLRASKRQAIA